MKITKSELRQLIQETLREELSKKSLKEEREFRSEFARLMSTPEGRKELDTMPRDEWTKLLLADRAADPVEQLLNKTKDYELDYKSFSRDWEEDKFDPNSAYGHYQDYGTDYYSDFSYPVKAHTLYEYLNDLLAEKVKEPSTSELMAEYKKLYQAWQSATGEAEDIALEALELFQAQNLYDLADLYIDEVKEHFSEDAYDWASENLEPDDY